jgi:hypothetical protein
MKMLILSAKVFPDIRVIPLFCAFASSLTNMAAQATEKLDQLDREYFGISLQAVRLTKYQ